MSKQILLPTLEDVGDAALAASVTNPLEAKRLDEATQRRASARRLLKATGESMVERRFSFWRWVWVDFIDPCSTELAFKQHYLQHGWGLDPMDTDPPRICNEDELWSLLADRSIPLDRRSAVREGAKRWLARFEKDGWGFLRETDSGYQKLGHRWRMKLTMREIRARKKFHIDHFDDLERLIVESGLTWDRALARIEFERIEQLKTIEKRVRVTKSDSRREAYQ